MIPLSIGSAVVVMLLALLVLGLLRSYATVLVRLDRLETRGPTIPGVGELAADLPAPPQRDTGTEATTIVGLSPDGQPMQTSLTPGCRNTLLAFLTSGCSTCVHFWNAIGAPDRPRLPGDARVVIVTKDPDVESPSRLRELGADALPVVQSTHAWEVYEVPGSPYFVYVDGATGHVRGEGTALRWEQIESLLGDAVMDSEMQAARRAGGTNEAPTRENASERAHGAEAALTAAGIGLDDPSLYSLSDHERASVED